MRSPATIGVDPAAAGTGTFQSTFSSALHEAGRPFSALTPSRLGPRQAGQSSTAAIARRIAAIIMSVPPS